MVFAKDRTLLATSSSHNMQDRRRKDHKDNKTFDYIDLTIH